MFRINGVKIAYDHEEHWMIDLDRIGDGWKTLSPLPLPRNHMGAVGLNGYFYALGGQLSTDEWSANQKRVDRYDPATDTWKTIEPLPLPLGPWPGFSRFRGGWANAPGRRQATSRRRCWRIRATFSWWAGQQQAGRTPRRSTSTHPGRAGSRCRRG